MNPGDFMGIGSVAQANAALRGLDDELEEARRRLDELKRQREILLDLRFRLCRHPDASRRVTTCSATSSPKFRPELEWAHVVTCADCGRYVDDAPVTKAWWND